MIRRKFRLSISGFPKKNVETVHLLEFTLKLTPNRLDHNRFGVILSSKVEPKSTRRHFLKRKILAALKNWPPLGKDVLIIVQKSPSPNFNFRAILEKTLNQIQNG